METTSTSHLSNQMRYPELLSDNTLHVVGVIQNPVRVASRYRLFRNWAAEMAKTPNVQLHVLEAVYQDRRPECAPLNNEYNYSTVETSQEIWLKENLINIAVRRLLPWDWEYLAWIDCDVAFHNPTWALDSLHALQHYNLIQPWSDALDLNADGSVFQTFKSFAYGIQNEKPKADPRGSQLYYKYFHTGYAWACDRYFYENTQGLLPWAILGAADNHMAWATQGRVLDTIHPQMAAGYKTLAKDWQLKAQRATHGAVGFVPGAISHFWHGKKADRGYWTRWQILLDNNYDPRHDLRSDRQGVLQVVNKPKLLQDIMAYNRSRNEDAI